MKLLRISKPNAEYQVISAIKSNRKKRKETGEIFVEGTESIKQLSKSGFPATRFICRNYRNLSDWAKGIVAGRPDAAVFELEESLYLALCDKTDPGELLVTAEMTVSPCEGLSVPGHPLILIMDRPGDKGNLGTIIRTANAFRIDAVIIIGHSVDVLDPKVIRTSLGAVFHTQIVQAESYSRLETLLTELKRETGLRVIGTDSGGDLRLSEYADHSPAAVILGNEAKGMSKKLQDLCDVTVSIPISGDVNSLNVSCAGSVILWHISGLTGSR